MQRSKKDNKCKIYYSDLPHRVDIMMSMIDHRHNRHTLCTAMQANVQLKHHRRYYK